MSMPESFELPLRVDERPNYMGAPTLVDADGRVIAYGTGFFPGEVRLLKELAEVANSRGEKGE